MKSILMGKPDIKSTREIIMELAKNNSTLQEVIAKAKEEVRFLRDLSRLPNGALGASGEGSSSDTMGNWLQRRDPIIKTRRGYESPADGEYDQTDKIRLRKKRMSRNGDPYMEKGERDRLDSKESIRRIEETRQLRRQDIAARITGGESVAKRTDSAAKREN